MADQDVAEKEPETTPATPAEGEAEATELTEEAEPDKIIFHNSSSRRAAQGRPPARTTPHEGMLG